MTASTRLLILITAAVFATVPGTASAHVLPVQKARAAIVAAGNAYYVKRGFRVDNASVRCQREDRHTILCSYALQRDGAPTSRLASMTAYYDGHASCRVRIRDHREGGAIP